MGNTQRIVEDDFWDLINQLEIDFYVNCGINLKNYKEAVDFIDETYRTKKKSDWNALNRKPERKNSSGNFISPRTLSEYWPINKQEEPKAPEDSEKKQEDEKKGHIPSERVLDIICVCIGYKNWTDYCRIKRKQVIDENTFFNPLDYNVDKMTKDDPPFRVGWYPTYFVEFKCIGKYQFEVVSHSYNITKKYRIGKKVTAYGFGIHYLYNMSNTSKDSKAVDGYPLFPTIFIKPSKDIEYNKNETGVFVIS